MFKKRKAKKLNKKKTGNFISINFIFIRFFKEANEFKSLHIVFNNIN